MRAAVCVVLCGVCGVVWYVWYVWYVRRVWRVHISISKMLWTNKERNEETSCVRDVTTFTPARQPFNTIAIVNLSKQVHNTPHNTSNTTTTTNPPTHHRTSVHDTPQHQHIHLHTTTAPTHSPSHHSTNTFTFTTQCLTGSRHGSGQASRSYRRKGRP